MDFCGASIMAMGKISALVLACFLVSGSDLGAAPLAGSGVPAQQQSRLTPGLITAARAQIGVTLAYDPAYTRIPFPNGDVARNRGVCTDVVIRAYRDAHGYDLQTQVNQDMKANFSSYPRNWGLSRPDSNIDHRRVPNLQVFLARKGTKLPISKNPRDYRPGDIITQMLPGNLPHILIISDRLAADGITPLVINNIGRGTREEDALFLFPLTGHYRLEPPARS